MVAPIIPVEVFEGIFLCLNHAAAPGGFNFVCLASLSKIVVEWRNSDRTDCKDFVDGVLVVDLVVDGLAAKRWCHLPVHPDNK